MRICCMLLDLFGVLVELDCFGAGCHQNVPLPSLCDSCNMNAITIDLNVHFLENLDSVAEVVVVA